MTTATTFSRQNDHGSRVCTISTEKISYSQPSSDLKLSIKRKRQLSPFCLLHVSNLNFGFQGGRLVFWKGCFNLLETDTSMLKRN